MNPYWLACAKGKRPWPSKVRIKIQQYDQDGQWVDLTKYTECYLKRYQDSHAWAPKREIVHKLERGGRVRIIVASMNGTTIAVREIVYLMEAGSEVKVPEYRVNFT